jgi:hypothetical protein
MSKIRIHSFTISIDGYGAGPNQNIEVPLGVGGEDLHNWMVKTEFFQKLYGDEEGTKGIDNDFTERGFANIGLARGFLDEICLDPFVVRGRMTVGKDGGERIHRIIVQYLF